MESKVWKELIALEIEAAQRCIIIDYQ